MIDRINEERRNAGLNELVIDEMTMDFSRYWAQHLTTDFRHSDWDDRREYVVAAGLSNLKPSEINGITAPELDDRIINTGENIAETGLGEKSAERLMRALLNSPGHKATMLKSYNKTVGVGFAVNKATGYVYCCQNFGLVIYEN